MRIVIIVLLVFSCHYSWSQMNSERQKKRLSFGFSFSPDYTYRNLKSDVDDMGFIDMRNEMESQENQGIAPQFGH